MSGQAPAVLALGPVGIVLLSAGLITFGLFVALLLGLGRQLRNLGQALTDLREGTEPIVDQIRAEGDRAQRTALALQAKQARMREERDRIRRARNLSRRVRRRRRR